jgi:L-2-hydroxyglutarate oxidase LhgO
LERVGAIVIGAGAVGLAIARQLSRDAGGVLVLEQEDAIGTGVSSRNSEVIHAGLYYNAGSLKAHLCVAGRRMLYSYCREHGVDARQCGKLVVADRSEQLPELMAIRDQGARNGVDDLELISATEAKSFEPELHCAGALLSPSSGIIDSHQYMLALQGDAESDGCSVVLRTPVLSGRTSGSRIILTAGANGDEEIAADLVVNSAGLSAQAVASCIEGLDTRFVPRLHLAKGNYFALGGRPPFRRLVYPVPEPGGLGIHFTLDLTGAGRFGPDVEWIDCVNYDVDPARVAAFHDSIRRYWPGYDPVRLQAAYAGVRPKVERPGGSGTDFIIQGPAEHGCAGLINLFGIESPGLTASLAIAEHVGRMARAIRQVR